MFSFVKSALNLVEVQVKGGIVHVNGIKPHVIALDIQRIWGTSRIYAWMFNSVSKHGFTFNEFFALDLVYVLETLLHDRTTKASRRSLAAIVRELRAKTWLAKIDQPAHKKFNRAKLALFHKTPMDKQLGFFDSYETTTPSYTLRGMLLAGAAGSGKTLTTCMMSEMLEVEQTIVVCPIKAVHEVWEKTLKNEMTYVPSMWLSDSGKAPKGNERYLVVHFEALIKFMSYLPLLKGKSRFVVLDESHHFNTSDSQRTELFAKMCHLLRVSDVVPMSGTPIKALGSEAVPLLRVIDPLFTPDTEFRFKKIFGISSTKGADILNARLNILSYKVEKKDLPIQAPDLQILPVKVPNGMEFTAGAIKQKMDDFVAQRLQYYVGRAKEDSAYFYGILAQHAKELEGPKEQADYRQYRRDLQVVIQCSGDARQCAEEIKLCNRYENTQVIPFLERPDQVKFKDIRSCVKYVLLKVRGECLGRVVAKERMLAHFSMIQHMQFDPIFDSSEKKTVVFTSFVEVLEKLLEVLTAQGHKCVSVYGKTNDVLSATLAAFEKDDDVNPLVATYKSLGDAVPLLMADVMILIDAPFRDYQLQQAISRTSRLGATTRTSVYMAQLDTGGHPNISMRSFDILQWSQNQIEAIIGIKSPFEVNSDLEKSELALESLDGSPVSEKDMDLTDFLNYEMYAMEGLPMPVQAASTSHANIRPSFADW